MAPRNDEAPSLTPSSEKSEKSDSSTSSASNSPQINNEWSQESIYRFLINNANQNAFQLLEEDLSNLQRQPTLLDLIVQSSGTQNVTSLQELRLRVLSGSYNLHHISSYSPHLSTLILDGSGLISLRDIGTGLRHLTVLKISRCGVTSLDGTFGLTSLQELYACDNHIENLAPCSALENSRILSFDGNPIKSMSAITMLSFCPNLSKLSLKKTPLSKKTDYRELVINSLPNLQKLDDLSTAIMNILDSPLFENQKSEDLSDAESSFTEISSMTEVSIDFGNSRSSSSKSENRSFKAEEKPEVLKRRPATALGITKSKSENVALTTRPKTSLYSDSVPEKCAELSQSFTASNLTSGPVICGNLGRALAKNRTSNQKRVQGLIEAYSMKQYEVNMVKNNASKVLENPLPEKPAENSSVVDLELGICSNSSETCKLKNSEPLKALQMWKKAFKAYRRENKCSSSKMVPKKNYSKK